MDWHCHRMWDVSWTKPILWSSGFIPSMFCISLTLFLSLDMFTANLLTYFFIFYGWRNIASLIRTDEQQCFTIWGVATDRQCSALYSQPCPELMDSWTCGAVNKHTTALTSRSRPSPCRPYATAYFPSRWGQKAEHSLSTAHKVSNLFKVTYTGQY